MMRRLAKILFILRRNPVLFLKLVRGKMKLLISRMFQRNLSPSISIGDIVFILNTTRLMSWREIAEKVLGIYEIAIEEAMRRYLRPGDIFIDVGANIGYLTALGASLVGREGEIHSFEPIPEYASDITMVAERNPRYTICVNACALGVEDSESEIVKTMPPYIGNSTFLPDLVEPEMSTERVRVPLRRLDAYIEQVIPHPGRIRLIKIDVEGFEFSVMKGMENFFKKHTIRPVIICEVKPDAYTATETCANFLNYMEQYGYRAYRIEAPWVLVGQREFEREINVVFRAKSLC